MDIVLNPEIRAFVEEQIRIGAYPTANALVEAAILQMREDQEIDDETIAAILEAEDQADRGECVDFDTFRKEWHARLGVR